MMQKIAKPRDAKELARFLNQVPCAAVVREVADSTGMDLESTQHKLETYLNEVSVGSSRMRSRTSK